MGLKSQSIKGFVWTTVEKFGNRVLSIFIFFFLAKLLGPKAMGEVIVINSIIAFVVIFIDQGLTTAIVQKDKVDETYLDTAFWGNMGISLIFGLGIFLMSPYVAKFYEAPALANYLRVISFSFLIGAVSRVQNALFIKEMKFKLLAVRRLISTFVGGAVGITMAFMDYGAWSLIWYQLSMMLVMTIILMIQSSWRPGLRFSWEHYIELLKFGVNVLGNNLLFYAQNHLVNLIIGKYLGMVEAGYYGVASKVYVSLKDMIINTFSKINLPIFAQLQNDKERRVQVFQQLTNKVLFFIFPVSVILAVLAPDLIHVFINKEEWIGSIPLLGWMLLACAFTVIPSFANDFLLGVGKASTSFRLNLTSTIIYLISLIIGIQFGLIGLAMAVTFNNIIAVPVALFFLGGVMEVQWKKLILIHGKVLLASALIAGTLYAFNYLYEGYNYLLLSLKTILAGASFLASLYLFYPELIEEIKPHIQRLLLKRNHVVTKS